MIDNMNQLIHYTYHEAVVNPPARGAVRMEGGFA